MLPFDLLFGGVAKRESRVIQAFEHPTLPSGRYIMREFFCAEPDCDCRRVLFHIHWRDRVVASINYAFEPPKPPFEDEKQMFLDPLNPQSKLSGGLFELIGKMIANDTAYRDQLIRHYGMWKRVVDDPSHPDHEKVVSVEDNPFSFLLRELLNQTPARRGGPRVGPNEPCPCGSGKKLKKCCRKWEAEEGRAAR